MKAQRAAQAGTPVLVGPLDAPGACHGIGVARGRAAHAAALAVWGRSADLLLAQDAAQRARVGARDSGAVSVGTCVPAVPGGLLSRAPRRGASEREPLSGHPGGEPWGVPCSVQQGGGWGHRDAVARSRRSPVGPEHEHSPAKAAAAAAWAMFAPLQAHAQGCWSPAAPQPLFPAASAPQCAGGMPRERVWGLRGEYGYDAAASPDAQPVGTPGVGGARHAVAMWALTERPIARAPEQARSRRSGFAAAALERSFGAGDVAAGTASRRSAQAGGRAAQLAQGGRCVGAPTSAPAAPSVCMGGGEARSSSVCGSIDAAATPARPSSVLPLGALAWAPSSARSEGGPVEARAGQPERGRRPGRPDEGAAIAESPGVAAAARRGDLRRLPSDPFGGDAAAAAAPPGPARSGADSAGPAQAAADRSSGATAVLEPAGAGAAASRIAGSSPEPEVTVQPAHARTGAAAATAGCSGSEPGATAWPRPAGAGAAAALAAGAAPAAGAAGAALAGLSVAARCEAWAAHAARHAEAGAVPREGGGAWAARAPAGASACALRADAVLPRAPIPPMIQAMRAAAAGKHPAQAAEPGSAASPAASPAAGAWAQSTVAATGAALDAAQGESGAGGPADPADGYGQGLRARAVGAHADPTVGFGTGRRACKRSSSRFGFAGNGGPGEMGAAAAADTACGAADPAAEESWRTVAPPAQRPTSGKGGSGAQYAEHKAPSRRHKARVK